MHGKGSNSADTAVESSVPTSGCVSDCTGDPGQKHLISISVLCLSRKTNISDINSSNLEFFTTTYLVLWFTLINLLFLLFPSELVVANPVTQWVFAIRNTKSNFFIHTIMN